MKMHLPRPSLLNVLPLAGLALFCGLAYPLSAVGFEALRGSIKGDVRSTAGTPQFGATVFLYNRVERQVAKALTNEKGEFAFSQLGSDQYSLRVTHTSFVPAQKRSILVQPGTQSLLAIRLSSVLSSIELISSGPQPGVVMSEDWKWTLRAGLATRPVLRFTDSGPTPIRPNSYKQRDSRGSLRVSAGDGGPWSASGANPDLGTAFSVVTPVEGWGDLQFTGNVGFVADSGSPIAAFRTTWNSDRGGRIHMTARQLLRPDRGMSARTPSLRMVEIGTYDQIRLEDDLTLDYGASMESSSFVERVNVFSGFARLTYQPTKTDSFQLAFNNGSAPLDLFFGEGAESDMQRDMAALSMLPRFSRVGDQSRVQRSRNLELGYKRTLGSRTLAVSSHYETIRDAVGTVTANNAEWDSQAILDFNSRGLIANLGRYRSVGMIGSVTQHFGESIDLTVAFGNSGLLGLANRNLAVASTDLLRDQVRMRNRQWASVRFAGIAPLTGTRFSTSYQWTETRALTPTHMYLTQPLASEAGFNIRLRQPIPRMFAMPGRFEATVEGRNILAEGYLPIAFANGQMATLVHSPRAFRGGFSYSF